MKNINDGNRAIRGSSWDVASSYCRASNRLGDNPGYRFINVGFRVVHRRRKP